MVFLISPNAKFFTLVVYLAGTIFAAYSKMKQATLNIFIFLLFFLAGLSPVFSKKNYSYYTDSIQTSTQSQAVAWLDSVQRTDSSKYWINVQPDVFFDNLRGFATSPLKFYEGRTNNFCAYSALTYLPLKNDPLGFCQFMLKLYQEGRAIYNDVKFKPGKGVLAEAGLLKYKGALDLNPAAQMWFLCLANRFKGYLNFVNLNFDKGDENTLWASTNFSKFNRMLRKVCRLKVRARGTDLIRPWIKDPYSHIAERLQRGTVFLYLNNKLLYRKKHTSSRFSIPTHYILLLDIQKVDDTKINIIYWDYGMKSLQQISPKLLRKAVFGITYAPNVK